MWGVAFFWGPWAACAHALGGRRLRSGIRRKRVTTLQRSWRRTGLRAHPSDSAGWCAHIRGSIRYKDGVVWCNVEHARASKIKLCLNRCLRLLVRHELMPVMTQTHQVGSVHLVRFAQVLNTVSTGSQPHVPLKRRLGPAGVVYCARQAPPAYHFLWHSRLLDLNVVLPFNHISQQRKKQAQLTSYTP
jgi:hypothetical protein